MTTLDQRSQSLVAQHARRACSGDLRRCRDQSEVRAATRPSSESSRAARPRSSPPRSCRLGMRVRRMQAHPSTELSRSCRTGPHGTPTQHGLPRRSRGKAARPMARRSSRLQTPRGAAMPRHIGRAIEALPRCYIQVKSEVKAPFVVFVSPASTAAALNDSQIQITKPPLACEAIRPASSTTGFRVPASAARSMRPRLRPEVGPRRGGLVPHSPQRPAFLTL